MFYGKVEEVNTFVCNQTPFKNFPLCSFKIYSFGVCVCDSSEDKIAHIF